MSSFDRFKSLYVDSKAEQPNVADKPVIMVVDDDLNIRNALSFTLRDKYDVRLCADGAAGIAQVDNAVNTVILDIKMPGIDGFQVYDTIQKSHPDIPIIFYSAFQDIMESVEFKRKYKPFGYFDKSGNTDELIARVDQAVQRRELVNKLKQETNRTKR